MSIFGSIMSKIFPKSHPAVVANANADNMSSSSGMNAPLTPPPSIAAPVAMQGAQEVDVSSILTNMAQQNSQKLDWQHSIVDLMKLLNLDSSITARKELARELGYNQDTSDSAAMNIWLHKKVMEKLAENGGRVPQDLLH
jgi:hypothetical protein